VILLKLKTANYLLRTYASAWDYPRIGDCRVTEENKIIQFPLREEKERMEIGAIVMKCVMFDGNRMWVDAYQQRESDGKMFSINSEPVSVGPGDTVTIILSKNPLDPDLIVP
jgi:hypothetical protein